MPALPAAGAVIQTRLIFNLNVAAELSGFRFFNQYTGGPPTLANLNALASAISTAWGAQQKTMLASAALLAEVQCLDLSVSPANKGQWVGSIGGTRGTPTGNQPTVDTCAIIELQIGRAYRGGKPKMFTPYGITTDFQPPDTWAGAFVTANDAAWTAFQSALAGITGVGVTLGSQCNVSYYQGHTPNPNPSVWSKKNVPARRASPVVDVVLAHATRQLIGVQSRRRGG
jgi:hypothetical protein